MADHAPLSPSFGSEDPPPRRGRAFVPLWVGLGEVEVPFTLLCARVLYYRTHFEDGRPIPCVGRAHGCPWCKSFWEPRTRGFITALRGGTGGRYLLQVTDYAREHCPELEQHQGELRGKRFGVRRLGSHKKTPWAWRMIQGVYYPTLPVLEDTEKILSRLWGIDLAGLALALDQSPDVRSLLRPIRTKWRNKR